MILVGSALKVLGRGLGRGEPQSTLHCCSGRHCQVGRMCLHLPSIRERNGSEGFRINPEVIFMQEVVDEMVPQILSLLDRMYYIFYSKAAEPYYCATMVSK